MKKYKFTIYFRSEAPDADPKQITVEMKCVSKPIEKAELLPMILREVAKSKTAIAWECKDL